MMLLKYFDPTVSYFCLSVTGKPYIEVISPEMQILNRPGKLATRSSLLYFTLI